MLVLEPRQAKPFILDQRPIPAVLVIVQALRVTADDGVVLVSHSDGVEGEVVKRVAKEPIDFAIFLVWAIPRRRREAVVVGLDPPDGVPSFHPDRLAVRRVSDVMDDRPFGSKRHDDGSLIKRDAVGRMAAVPD